MTIDFFDETIRRERAQSDPQYRAMPNRVAAGFLIGGFQHLVGLVSYGTKKYPATLWYDYPQGYNGAFILNREVIIVTNPEDIEWVLALP